MSRAVRAVAYAVAAALAACAATPTDPFAVAERAFAARDLPAALGAYDAVPVGHARYPDARAQAALVERDLRRCHEAVHEALRLRAEWRDRAAVAALERAQQAWPTMPGLDVLLAATQARSRELAAAAPTAIATAQQAVVDQGVALPAAPAAEYAPVAPRAVAPVAAEVAAALAQAEAMLARGETEPALAALLALAERAPDDQRARTRACRLLCQRGLLRYGAGEVDAAIADFERAHALAPEHETARRLLDQARAEPR